MDTAAKKSCLGSWCLECEILLVNNLHAQFISVDGVRDRISRIYHVRFVYDRLSDDGEQNHEIKKSLCVIHGSRIFNDDFGTAHCLLSGAGLRHHSTCQQSIVDYWRDDHQSAWYGEENDQAAKDNEDEKETRDGTGSGSSSFFRHAAPDTGHLLNTLNI